MHGFAIKLSNEQSIINVVEPSWASCFAEEYDFRRRPSMRW